MNQKRPNVLLLAKLRQLHSYFAMFAAPSIIFFCLTGVLQLFSFHEAHGDYRPPAAVQALGRLHKDQVLAVHRSGGEEGHDGPPPAGAHRPDMAGAPGEPAGHAGRRPDKTAHWTMAQILLKLVFAAAAITATVSAGLGIWVGLSFGPKRKLLAWILAAGVVVPTLLAVFVSF